MDFRILIVEDEARLREVVCDYFRSRGDTPFEAENACVRWSLSRTRSLTPCCWTS